MSRRLVIVLSRWLGGVRLRLPLRLYLVRGILPS